LGVVQTCPHSSHRKYHDHDGVEIDSRTFVLALRQAAHFETMGTVMAAPRLTKAAQKSDVSYTSSPEATAVAWVLLLIAGLLETVWAFTMKKSDGFTRPAMTVATAVAMVGSIGLLSVSMRTLPLGTSYPVWTGIGAVGTFLVGVIVLGESLNVTRAVAAVLIVAGLLLMKASASS
jgi:quaternary ammonium compound-resistance protein SugE